MGNRDVSAAWDYHNATKHTYWSVRGGHGLDWPNQPLPFKIYKDVESIRLPRDGSPITAGLLEALGASPASLEGESVPDLGLLARILYFSAGITKRMPYTGGEIFFRAAACTGALYHIDLYLVCGDMPGLEAGIYHFGPHDFGLVQLRKGDFRRVLVEASGEEPAVAEAPVTVVLADTHWRNAWKYGARAYRHAFWDSGTLLANMLAAASGAGVPARVVTSFVDEEVHRLLGLEAEKESVIALVPLGRVPGQVVGETPPIEPLNFPTEPLSPKMVEYPAIYDFHESSSLAMADEVRGMRNGKPTREPDREVGEVITLPRGGEGLGDRTLEETIVRRGSTRAFAHESISLEQLAVALDYSTRGIDADFLPSCGSSLNQLFLIVNAVDGLAPGAYLYHRGQHALEMLKEGDFRREAGYLGLEQKIPADASVNVYMLADLNQVLGAYGNRGYRMAELESGIIGGRLYLVAYGTGFGASGLTFYDDEVSRVLRAEGGRAERDVPGGAGAVGQKEEGRSGLTNGFWARGWESFRMEGRRDYEAGYVAVFHAG